MSLYFFERDKVLVSLGLTSITPLDTFREWSFVARVVVPPPVNLASFEIALTIHRRS